MELIFQTEHRFTLCLSHRLNPPMKIKVVGANMVPSASERLIVWELTIPSWLLKVRHQRYHRLLTRCWPWLTPDTANTCAIDKTWCSIWNPPQWIDDHIWPSIWEHNPCLDHHTHVSTSHKSMVWNMWHTNVSRNSSHYTPMLTLILSVKRVRLPMWKCGAPKIQWFHIFPAFTISDWQKIGTDPPFIGKQVQFVRTCKIYQKKIHLI